jgi:hypothetical protein
VSVPDGLEQRVAALESAVRELAERVRRSEQDAAAARVLAGGADRDVAEIRGEIRDFREQNTRVLNALREDLTDLRSSVDGRFVEVRRDMTNLREHVDRGFVEVRGRLDATAAGQQQIVDLLTTLIARRDDE